MYDEAYGVLEVIEVMICTSSFTEYVMKVLKWAFLLISDDNWKILVMIGTLLYVFGSCESQMRAPFRPIPKEDSSSLTFL